MIKLAESPYFLIIWKKTLKDKLRIELSETVHVISIQIITSPMKKVAKDITYIAKAKSWNILKFSNDNKQKFYVKSTTTSQKAKQQEKTNLLYGYFKSKPLAVWPHDSTAEAKAKETRYFVTKIVLTYCEKKLFYWSRFFFEIWDWRPRICKKFEITRTIYSSSERSEQFLVTECFFNLFLEVFQIE